MPLQSSGPISIGNIRNELGTSNGSLRALSAAAGFSSPDAISEFYGFGNITYTLMDNPYFYSDPCSGAINLYYGSNGLYYANTSGTLYNGSVYEFIGFNGFDYTWYQYIINSGVLFNAGLLTSPCSDGVV